MVTVDRVMEHVVCYVDRKTNNGSYPKCVACGLPGHSIDQCHPLINFCLAGALARQHPDIVRKIQATYKLFPRTARGRPSRPPTVKQLVAALDLPLSMLDSAEPPVVSDSIDQLASPDLDAPHLYHGQTGTAVVTFHDHTDVAGHPEPVATSFTVDRPEASMFLLFQEHDDASHAVMAISTLKSVLVESGSTLNTVGDSSLLHDYASPSPSPIKMRSATGHIVRPSGQGTLPFKFNDGTGSLDVQCQHTLDIASSIFSPAETCERLDYDSYTLSCDRTSLKSSVTFAKPGKPDIRLIGTYVNILPLLPLSDLPPRPIMSVAPCRSLSTHTDALASTPLSADLTTAMHQFFHVCTRLAHHVSLSDCRSMVLHACHDAVADDMTHGGSAPFPVLHVTDAVNRTLWHLRTCHPHPDRLIQISKMSKGMPNIRHPQQIEKCSECLVAKMRKAARGSDPSFVATHLGQALALDVGLMFQRSKDDARAKMFTGLNGGNAYCIVYDFKAEVLFGITSKGKRLSLPWLHLLLTRIAPPASVSRHIIRMDLGGETGLNPDVQELLDRHGYITQLTGAGSSSQNGMAERPHQTIDNAIRAVLISAHLPP
jgi:hypothetical protein